MATYDQQVQHENYRSINRSTREYLRQKTLYLKLWKTDMVINRCLLIPQSLSESLHQQEENLMDDLHSSADSLIKTCKPEVSAEVEASVKETVEAWDEKTVQLEDLCKRYQQAVELWSRYKQASDAIASWSDELLHSVNDLPPEEALKVRTLNIGSLHKHSGKMC